MYVAEPLFLIDVTGLPLIEGTTTTTQKDKIVYL